MKKDILTVVGMKYADDYDRATVEYFRQWERDENQLLAEILTDDPEREMKIHGHKLVHDIVLYFKRAERAERRGEYVRECVEADRKRETLLASVHPRTDIPCLRCQTSMVFQTKTTESTSRRDQDRVLIIYSCPNKCVPGRAFYDNGEEWRSKPTSCEECNRSVETKSIRKGDVIIFTDSCVVCGHVKKHTFELPDKKRKATVDEYYAKDRERFCMTDDKLHEYIAGKFQMKRLDEIVNGIKERKEEDAIEDATISVRMLKVMEMQTLIVESLKKVSFLKVMISDPTHADGLRVKITAFDNDAARTDDASKKSAETTIELALRGTNWRLAKGSLNVTLGALAGVVNGYTSETEVRNLIKAEKDSKVSKNNEKNPT